MPVCTCCGVNVESHKIVNCTICSKPFKSDCMELTNSEVRKIQQRRSGLSWSCKDCAAFGNTMNELKVAIVALQNEIKSLKSSIASPPESCTSLVMTEKIIQEISEHDKRMSNIMIYGCIENNGISKEDQAKLDTTVVMGMLQTLGTPDIPSDIKHFRVGKLDQTNQNRSRPIKVILSSEKSVLSVIRNARQLKSSSEWATISIFRDRTPMQMEIHRNAKKELEDRLANGEMDLTIKYRNGIPSVVSSLN